MFAVSADHATPELRMGKLDWRLSEVWGRNILLKPPSTGVWAGWYIGESIGFTNIRRPYRRVMFFFSCEVQRSGGQLEQRTHLAPIQPRSVMSCLESMVYDLQPSPQDLIKHS